nr:protein nrt1/ ptr family 7.3 [Quercus suber]
MKGCGLWDLGVKGSAFVALVLFLVGSSRYKHFKPNGNPLSKFCYVIVAAANKWRVKLSPNAEDFYVVDGIQSSTNGNRRIFHTHGFRLLDKAAFITSGDFDDQNQGCLQTLASLPNYPSGRR